MTLAGDCVMQQQLYHIIIILAFEYIDHLGERSEPGHARRKLSVSRAFPHGF
jgi:hypothetical protein